MKTVKGDSFSLYCAQNMSTKCDFFIFLNIILVVSSYELKEVLILSRHSIRAPLMANLEQFSSNSWPKWKESAGHLTQKGGLLEEYMGEYISNWLIKEKLLNEGCPAEKSVHIYANTRQRARESAKAFVRGAFRNCNVTVVSIDSEDMDPVFNPAYRNSSEALKDVIVKEMQIKLSNLDLRKSYIELEKIIDFKNSKIFKIETESSLADTKDEIYYEIGEEPNVIGPLERGNSIVDSFLMGYYEGFPLKNVAWGKIHNSEQWEILTKITKENQNVRFNSTILGREIAKPLLQYIFSMLNSNTPLKFTLLHGHDSNLNSVMAALGFKWYLLPEQYETTPIGGKLVFQKWHDNVQNKNLLKVGFLYQTVHQLREGTKLSDKTPPRWIQLTLNSCPTDSNGFCPWEDFMKILNNASDTQ